MSDIKKLIIDIDAAIHRRIKTESAQENITIKDWVTRAIAEYMAYRDDLKNK